MLCDVMVSILFYLKDCQVMVIRRGGSHRYCVDFARLEMK